MTLSVNIPVRGRKITNGDVIKALFPDIEINYYKNLMDMRVVDVNFKNSPIKLLQTHTFSREWWDSIYEEKKYE